MKKSNRRICYNCIGESFLKAETKQNGKNRICSFCKTKTITYSLQQISQKIRVAFENHYSRTNTEPKDWESRLLADKESAYYWERSGSPVVDAIMDAAGVEEEPANEIREILADHYYDQGLAEIGEENEFDEDSYYEEKAIDDEVWQEEWNKFEESLKKEARFFNSIGVNHLKSVFKGIEKLKTRDNRPIFVKIGPREKISALYRARVFQTDTKLKMALSYPDKELGPPPSPFATAGRMNASGISVFYGATEPGIAVAEVRPPVGSQVVVARFSLIRSLNLLDLTALSDNYPEGSIFDESYAGSLEKAMFLRNLSSRLTKPIMPDDAIFEYLPTQAISDFLASCRRPKVDGIIFKSSQKNDAGVNVVLFNKASRVKGIALPEGTKVSASTVDWESDEEKVYPSYRVIIEAPQEVEKPQEKDALFIRKIEYLQSLDNRKTCLEIDTNYLKVHIVKAIKFVTDEHTVLSYHY